MNKKIRVLGSRFDILLHRNIPNTLGYYVKHGSMLAVVDVLTLTGIPAPRWINTFVDWINRNQYETWPHKKDSPRFFVCSHPRSQHITHHSSLITRHSSLVIHHSSLITLPTFPVGSATETNDLIRLTVQQIRRRPTSKKQNHQFQRVCEPLIHSV